MVSTREPAIRFGNLMRSFHATAASGRYNFWTLGDPMFGVMVSCGSGGLFTELIDDVVTERAPVGVELAAHMLERLRTRRHATDSMGLLPTHPAARFVARFAELALTVPWERFVFEVNPVSWRRDDAIALDGLLIVG